jgi:hypothetical protein
LKLKKKDGGPGESRTPDQRFRKPLLYPSELQARSGMIDFIAGDGATSNFRSAAG